MSFFHRVSSLVLTATLGLSFAACSGDDTCSGSSCGGGGAGGHGTTTTSSSWSHEQMVAAFCKASLACEVSATCTLVDAAGAESACVDAYRVSLGALKATLGDAQVAIAEKCVECAVAQTPEGQCFGVAEEACDNACDTNEVEMLFEALTVAVTGDDRALCTSGQNVFGGSCEGSGDDTSCAVACCNGLCGSTPTVAVDCQTQGAATTCTCTAGKNTGKTFQATDACGGEDGAVWTQCNL